MKRTSLFKTFLCLTFSAFASAASAEWGDTYQDTCSHIQRNGSYLSAYCLNFFQRYQKTEIDLRACGVGGVSNRNGALTCNNPVGVGRPRPSEPTPYSERRYERRSPDYDRRDYDRRGYDRRDYDRYEDNRRDDWDDRRSWR